MAASGRLSELKAVALKLDVFARQLGFARLGAEDWQAMQRMVEEVADELALDAHKAIDGLKKDKEIWNRLQAIKDKSKSDKEEDKGD